MDRGPLALRDLHDHNETAAAPPNDPVYIGARDSTFAGSRNGLSAVVLRQYLATHSFDRQIDKEVTLAELAGYVTAHLIDALVRDLSQPDAFPDQAGEGAHVARVRAVPGSDEVTVPYEGRGFR